MKLPQPTHGVLTDPLRLGHQPTAPMRHPFGLGLQGRVNDGVPLGLIVVRSAAATGCNLPHFPNASGTHSLAPQIYGGPTDSHARGYLLVSLARLSHQDDPAPERYLLRCALGGFPLFQLRPLAWAERDRKPRVTHGESFVVLSAICKVI